MNNIKVTGEWDGEPIWRRETAEERLFSNLPPNLDPEENELAEIEEEKYGL